MFSYVTSPAATISLPVRPQDCIILSSILSWLKEIFSLIFAVKKKISWIAHAVPDVTKSGTRTPCHKVPQSVNRFCRVISLKRNRGFKPSFIGRNSRQVGNSQRFLWAFLVFHDLLNFAFVLPWVDFCGSHYNLCITCTVCSQGLKTRTNLWGVKSVERVIWPQRLTRGECLGTGLVQVKSELPPINQAKGKGTLEDSLHQDC